MVMPCSTPALNGLEGLVSKHVLAPYSSGRRKTWLKTKCFTVSTFVVVGTDRDRKTGAQRKGSQPHRERVSFMRVYRLERPKETRMDTTTLLIILVVLLLIFGGGFYGRGRWY